MSSGNLIDPDAKASPGAPSEALAEVKASWDALGRIDPMFAILTEPSKRDRRWNEQEFFGRGETEIETVFSELDRMNMAPTRSRALDFGCGIGRNTQALAARFESVVGVDIAPSMIAQAEGFNRHGSKCSYRVLDSGDLGALESSSFDFVYSVLVLQHMPTPSAERYIGEFFRVLRPGGVLVFQIPDSDGGRPSLLARARALAPRFLVAQYRRLRYGESSRYRTMTNILPRVRVEQLVASHGGRLARASDDPGFRLRYWVTKQAGQP